MFDWGCSYFSIMIWAHFSIGVQVGVSAKLAAATLCTDNREVHIMRLASCAARAIV